MGIAVVGGVSSSRHFTLSSATRPVTGAAERDGDLEVAAEFYYLNWLGVSHLPGLQGSTVCRMHFMFA